MPSSSPDSPNAKRADATTGLLAADVSVEMLWSRYCPKCGQRQRLSEACCPADGTPLRDLSVRSTAVTPTPEAIRNAEALLAQVGIDPVEVGDGEDHPLVGQILGGRWRVEEWIGRGGFGNVFQGRHVILDVPVAIKVLRAGHTQTVELRRRFYAEALRVSRFDHPNVVRVFDYGEQDDGQPYLVMEWLTGRSLAGHLVDGDYPLRDGVEVVRQAAVALIAAHQGEHTDGPLVHLDLKPEHFFLDQQRDGLHVKVIDFGLAEIAAGAAGAQSDTGIAGTIPYMAPERWRGVVDPRADLYSLGVVLYELIAGRLPFHADTPLEVQRLHEEVDPTPPSAYRRGPRPPLLPELDAVVLHALAKRREDRPQSAEELVHALERWQRRAGWPVWRRVWQRARWFVAAAAILCAGFLVLHAMTTLHVQGPTDPQICVGPESGAVSLSPGLSGWWRDLDSTVLVVKHKGREKRIAANARGCCDPRWEDVHELAGEQVELDCSARFEVTGLLGREFHSPWFGIRLDRAPPSILLRSGGVADRDSLYVAEGSEPVKLEFKTNEPTTGVTCDGGVPRWTSESAQSICVTLHPSAESLCLTILDRAGNELTWIRDVRRLALRINESDQATVYTNRSRIGVEVVNAANAHVRVHSDAEPQERGLGITDGRGHYELSSDRGRHTERVTFRVWPMVSSITDKPVIEKTITVEFHKRTLEIKLREGSWLASQCWVADEGGRLVEDATVERHAYSMNRSGDPERIKLGAAALLKGGLGRMAPGFYLTLQAEDQFGNQSVRRKVWPGGLPKPTVSIRIPESAPGSDARNPLHGPWCCPERNWSRGIRLECRITYPFRDRLKTVQLRLGDKVVTRDPRVGGFTIPAHGVQQLPGTREWKSIAYSGTDPELETEFVGSIKVCLGKRLDLNVRPEPTIGSANIKVEGWTGCVREVRIDGQSQELENGSFAVKDVPRVGARSVRVELVTTDGCLYEQTVDCCSSPESKRSYAFNFGPALGELWLRYYSSPTGAFWYTESNQLVKQLADYRESVSAVKCPAGSCREAREFVKWFESKLSGKLASCSAMLPDAAMLQELKRSDATREWVSDVHDKIKGSARFVRGCAESFEKLWANDLDVGPVFRLVVTGPGLSLRHARGVR